MNNLTNNQLYSHLLHLQQFSNVFICYSIIFYSLIKKVFTINHDIIFLQLEDYSVLCLSYDHHFQMLKKRAYLLLENLFQLNF